MPPPSEPQAPQARFLPILLTGMVGTAAFVALCFLTLGWMGPVLAVVVGVFAFAALHYVVWGWWLSRIIRDEAEEENDEP